jgi:ERCC4-related helicase
MYATNKDKKSEKRIFSPEDMLRNFENTLATEDDYNDDATDWMAVAGNSMPSSKVLKTRDVIREWFKDATDTKLVIFTQFRAMTHIFYHMCKKEGWACAMVRQFLSF